MSGAGSELTHEQRRRVAARLLAQQRAERSSIGVAPRADDSFPLTGQQEGLWFLEQLRPSSPAYNIPVALRTSGVLDEAALVRAHAALVERHEAMRMGLVVRDGAPRMRLDCPPEPMALVDASGVRPEERDAWCSAAAAAEAATPFGRAPLSRARLVRLAADDHLLLMSYDHLVMDGWSLALVNAELGELYRAEAGAGSPELSGPGLSTVDYAHWQRERYDSSADRRYWREQLSDGEPLRLLAMDSGPRDVDSGDGYAHHLAADLARRARARAREWGHSDFAVLAAAFVTVLSGETAADDVLFGTVFNGRTEAELEKAVGYFANTVPLRVSLPPGRTFGQLVQACDDAHVDAQRHQLLPLPDILGEVGFARRDGVNPLFELTFSTIPTTHTGLGMTLGDARVRAMSIDLTSARFAQRWEATTSENGIDLWVEYSVAHFGTATVERQVREYETALEFLLDYPDVSISAYLGGSSRVARLPRRPPQPRGAASVDAGRLSASDHVVVAEWQRVLERQGAPDWGTSFFDQGGRSLGLARLRSRIESELGVALSLLRMYQQPFLCDVVLLTRAAMADAAVGRQGSA